MNGKENLRFDKGYFHVLVFNGLFYKRNLNASQHTKIKEDQLSFNNPKVIHDFPITFNDLYITLNMTVYLIYISDKFK